MMPADEFYFPITEVNAVSPINSENIIIRSALPSKLSILDMTDLKSMTIKDSIDLKYSGWLEHRSNRLFLYSETERKFRYYDVGNNTFSLKAELSTYTNLICDIFNNKNEVYILYDYKGYDGDYFLLDPKISVYTVDNIENMSGILDTGNYVRELTNINNWDDELKAVFTKNYMIIYKTMFCNTLYVYNITNKSNPIFTGTVDFDYPVFDIVTKNGFIFLTLNVSEGNNPIYYIKENDIFSPVQFTSLDYMLDDFAKKQFCENGNLRSDLGYIYTDNNIYLGNGTCLLKFEFTDNNKLKFKNGIDFSQYYSDEPFFVKDLVSHNDDILLFGYKEGRAKLMKLVEVK